MTIGWLRSPPALCRSRRQLRAYQPVVAIDLQGLSKSAIAARLSGARRRIGFGGRDGREISRWLNRTRIVPTATHVIDRNLELLRPLGIVSPTVRFNLPQPPQDAAWMDCVLLDCGLVAGRLAIVNPGAGWKSKLWPPDRFAAVATHLGQIGGLPTLIVWAGAAERAWAEQIVAESSGHAVLAPPTTLMQL